MPNAAFTFLQLSGMYSHIIQFTNLKCTVQWVLVYSQTQPSPQSNFMTFSSLKKPHTHWQSLPIPVPPLPHHLFPLLLSFSTTFLSSATLSMHQYFILYYWVCFHVSAINNNTSMNTHVPIFV